MKRYTLPSERSKNRKAGLSVATINIPLSISLALASGLDPLVGLLTGIRGCGLAAVTASSKHNVFGIAGALSGIILLFVREFGVERISLLTIVSGLIIVLMRLLGFVKYITLIPASALHGFVIGVGLIILTNQLPDMVGLHTLTSSGVLSVLHQTFIQYGQRNFFALSIGSSMLLFLLLRKKYVPQFPGVLIATILGIVIGYISNYMGRDSLVLLQDKYPNLQFSLFHFPTHLLSTTGTQRIAILPGVFKTAAVIAIIAVVETIVSAKIATNMTKEPFDKDQEVWGLGITNILGGLIGIAPTTAVFVRTALNIKSGATNTSAALITAIATALISLFLFKTFFLLIPLSIIAAILISIALGMINMKHLRDTHRIHNHHGILMGLVALVTFFEDPIFGILAGVGGTLLLQIAEKTKPHLQCSRFHKGKFIKKGTVSEYIAHQHKNDLLVIKMPSEITYLNSDTMIEEIRMITSPHQVVLSFSQVYSIDIDGLAIIDELVDFLSQNGSTVHFTGIQEVKKELQHSKWYPLLHASHQIWDNTSMCLNQFVSLT